MQLGVNLLNHTLAEPFNIVRKAQHMISSVTPCKSMRVLNDSRWFKGSFDLSYASIYDIWNFVGRGNEVMGATNGESIWWTSSSRLFDTYPLRAFTMKSILSFIIWIFATICCGAVFMTDGRLVSYCFCLLDALLPSSSSWPLLSALVPSCSSLWLWGSASF